MRPDGPKFFLINGQNGWCTANNAGTSASLSGIRLAEDPNGPLALTSMDKSLGGLVLPPNIAIDEQGTIYLLLHDDAKILRFNPDIRCFKELPGIGEKGQNARQLTNPAAITIAVGCLYIADRGNQRVQVFDLENFTLRHIWGPMELGGEETGIVKPIQWDPVDIAEAKGVVYILDRFHAGIYCHKPGTDHPKLLFQVPGLEENWSRIALDREERIYLLNEYTGVLDIYNRDGEQQESVQNPGAVRDRFYPPLIRLDHQGRFCIPSGLIITCAREASAPSLEIPLEGCPPYAEKGLIFDQAGNPIRIDPSEQPGPKPYRTQGEWLGRPLNSQIYRCQWHRIELDLADLPVGSQVEVCTYTVEQADQSCHETGTSGQGQNSSLAMVPDDLWQTHFKVTGPMQSPANREIVASQHEFLIQSREGQYLQLRLKLSGDGYATPVVREMRIHYPRQSYLNYLPAVYSEDNDSRWFLERFLSAFQTRLEQLEQHIDDMPRLFDPEAVPEGGFLLWLAGLLGLPLEGSWDWEQKRRLLTSVSDLYQRRGQPGGLSRFLTVYLANMTGISTEQVEETGYPIMVEGFKARQYLMLSQRTSAALGHGAPLWGPAKVARLQLGVFSREGEVRLVSTGDPERDLFHEYAHQFRVFVPSAWIRSASDERMIRRALDSEKPVHTQYSLCLVDSRFQIGIQASLGMDTIIGDYPKTRLGCALNSDFSSQPENSAPAPSRPPQGRLGIDTVLSGKNESNKGYCLNSRTRIGANNRII